MKTQTHSACLANRKSRTSKGVVLAEAMIAVAVFGMVVGTVLSGYIMASRRMQWAGSSAAAQAMAVESVEKAISAKWTTTGTDEMKLLTTNQIEPLVLSGLATNYISIVDVSTNSPLLRMVTVECRWSYLGKKYTNTVAVLRGPNY